MRLLESKKSGQKGRSAGGTLFSVILHSLIIFLAVFATARAGVRKAEKSRETKVDFVAVKKEPPPPPKKEVVKPEPPKPKNAPTPPKVVNVPQPKVVAPAPPQGFKVVAPPVNIPTNLPAIDLSKAITNENDFSGKGVAGGSANGVKGGTGKEGDTGKEAGAEHAGPYMEFQVEKPVEKIGGEAPEYPASLRDSGVEGEVLAQFVVGENGRYEGGSLKILKSSNPAFSAAVKDALPRMKFSAAQIGGKKVAQLVQMPFQFNLKK
ncbi:MAG: TonB family protein [Gemmatimonadota bacterium]|nr:TonB family protein [Gemmatimonadota bacterium]